jgi:hypothetical protein
MPTEPPRPVQAPAAAISAGRDRLDAVYDVVKLYDRHAEELRTTLRTVATAHDRATGERLSALLHRSGPCLDMPLFGGVLTQSATVVGRCYVLWGLAYNGRGRVPAALLAAPWLATRNDAEKYVEPAPLAMWAAARIG